MYLCQVVTLELPAKEQASSAMIAARVQGLLDHYAKQGWEFMHLESVPVTVQPGCLAAFAGGRPQVVFLPQLIFRLDENTLRQISHSGG
jgi:hypothetical protein